MRSGSRRSFRRRWRISATTFPTISASIRCSARSPTSMRWLRPRTTRPQGHPRFRAESYVRPASLVRREPRVARQPEARLVHLARSGSRTAARRTTGCRNSAAAPGSIDEQPGSITITPSCAQQPDLNWRNPQVREAMYDVMRFWLRRGVDGFRVDVIWHLIKDAEFRDNPPNPALSRRPAAARADRCRSIRPISRKCMTSSPRCGACSTRSAIAC